VGVNQKSGAQEINEAMQADVMGEELGEADDGYVDEKDDFDFM